MSERLESLLTRAAEVEARPIVAGRQDAAACAAKIAEALELLNLQMGARDVTAPDLERLADVMGALCVHLLALMCYSRGLGAAPPQAPALRLIQ